MKLVQKTIKEYLQLIKHVENSLFINNLFHDTHRQYLCNRPSEVFLATELASAEVSIPLTSVWVLLTSAGVQLQV